VERARTKQVCTIGPASADRIAELVAAGLDVARVNFSHGTPDDHRAYVHAVRGAAHAARRSVAVMADLPGPKLRLGDLGGGELRLETGAAFALRDDESALGDATGAAVPRASLATQLQVGDRVLLADGAAELRVTEIVGADVTTEVVNGGLVRSRSGVNIPSERLAVEGLTEEDRAALPRALELRVDLIAQSFVRTADDVRALRALLPTEGPRVVAKIETRAAIDNFDEICQVADGIMVARGDLGVDIPFEEVPLVQKDLIRRATAAGKFSIVATQMLESMTGAPRPTRAEASDVANAVLDGADGVMLSAESAIGAYPVQALEAMERICARTEQSGPTIEQDWWMDRESELTSSRMLVAAATLMTRFGSDNAPDAIWCFTRSGRTAEMVSLTRPRVPIVAFTLSPVVARRLAVRRGIVPVVLPAGARQATPVPLIERMESAWRAQRGSSEHRSVILVTTSPQPNGINRLELHSLAAAPVATRPPARPARERPPRPAQVEPQPPTESPAPAVEAPAPDETPAAEPAPAGETPPAAEAEATETPAAEAADPPTELESQATPEEPLDQPTGSQQAVETEEPAPA
jgi:pyruvate kinase